jgi:general secretion pathway protein I
MTPRRAHAGFSLLEALLALTIFAVCFALVLEALGRGLSNARTALKLSEAALWAQNRLDSLGVTEKLEARTQTGQFNRDYRYELVVEPFVPTDSPNQADQTFPIQLFRVDLTVIWEVNGQPRRERFVTLKSKLRDGAFF